MVLAMPFDPAQYPAARRLELVEDLFGHQVADPYRWLEDSESGQSEEWRDAQEALWERYRDQLPRRQEFAGRVGELLRVGSVGTPVHRGERRFYTRRDPGQEHGVLYVSDGEEEKALVDPNALDPEGRSTLDAWSPDKEGRLLAYQVSAGGTEESLLHVIDVATGQQADGPIDRCRYSGIAWLPGGKAFYYTRRLPAGQVPDGESQYHRRVYLHTVGTDPRTDTMVFGEGRDKTSYYGAGVSRDGRWLTISASIGTAPRDDLWLADLTASDPAKPDLKPVTVGLDAQSHLHAGRDGRLYVYSDLDAPRGRIAIADPANPGPESWADLIAEDPEAVLRDYAVLDGAGHGAGHGADDGSDDGARPVLLVSWTRHAIAEITVHDLATGEKLSTLELPGIGTVGGLSERPEGGHEAWFAYTDYTTPARILRYDAATGDIETWATPPGSAAKTGAANPPQVTARQVTYTSKDGTPVRMVIVEPGSGTTIRSVERPFILYGYGGFNIPMTPGYSPSILAWAEAGGGYAIAALRGGSEEGEEWHRAGMLGRKQNVFDDFHAAAGYLIDEGLTTRRQLAVSGGSNGGLLVGAAVTQRPDLFAAAVCSAPLLDMVRYERFGLGELWRAEYGSAAVPGELEWLLGYSPYHRVAGGTGYPSVLFTVFTNDTRVDPLHAYKTCAALQHATTSGKPVLLRAEAQVGHGARAVSRTAGLSGDTLAFVAAETGLDG